jgi:hypothetical protein
VEGFFKGVGKGLMGLMIKPAGGVLDCISMAMDGIKRWESSTDTSHIPFLNNNVWTSHGSILYTTCM